MIYFDSKKDAYAFKIKDPIATVEDEVWYDYSFYPCGKAWDIIDGKFTPLKTIEELRAEVNDQHRIIDLQNYLAETDYIITKINEAMIEDADEAERLREQYAEELQNRKNARAEINKLEKGLE